MPANQAREGLPCRVLAADGTWRHIEATVSSYKQPGERGQLLVTARDVSDQVALRQQVTHLTFHDRLTGLPNRVYFEERVADVLGRRVHHGDQEPVTAGRSNRAGRSSSRPRQPFRATPALPVNPAARTYPRTATRPRQGRARAAAEAAQR